jgi:hypothetical protein
LSSGGDVKATLTVTFDISVPVDDIAETVAACIRNELVDVVLDEADVEIAKMTGLVVTLEQIINEDTWCCSCRHVIPEGSGSYCPGCREDLR